jgi:hypothetical protein
MPKCEKCGNDFPVRIKIDGISKVLNTRKYCLDCSPFGLHNTKKINNKPRKDQTEYKCSICGETDHTKFYGNKRSRCGKCHNEYTTKKSRDNKKYAIDKFDGKCLLCGFHDFQEGLAFHHLNPNEKDSNFKGLLGWSKERIDNELKGCVCLCLTCHAGVHAGYLVIGV